MRLVSPVLLCLALFLYAPSSRADGDSLIESRWAIGLRVLAVEIREGLEALSGPGAEVVDITGRRGVSS